MPTLETKFKEAGIPVKTGIRQYHNEKNAAPYAVASNAWLHRWAKHAAQNYPIIARSWGTDFLKGAAMRVPAFVVGIGPSLDENIKSLKQADGRALILATDAALRPLLANGIRPHLVMTFDCQKDQKTLWETASDIRIPLVCTSCTHPETIEAWDGPILFFNQWHKKDEYIDRLLPYTFPHIGQIPSLGTVGNMLVVLANFMGCAPVMTVGMDLCYKEVTGPGAKKVWKYRCKDYRLESNDHIAGAVPSWKPTENKILYENNSRVARSSQEKIGNETYQTDPELKAYREGLIGACEGLGIKPVDCSVGGTLREYFRNITVDQAINEFCMEELGGGRTIIPYLRRIIPNGKAQWDNDRRSGNAY